MMAVERSLMTGRLHDVDRTGWHAIRVAAWHEAVAGRQRGVDDGGADRRAEVVDGVAEAEARQRRVEAGAQDEPPILERGEQVAEPPLLVRGHVDRPPEGGRVEAVGEGNARGPHVRGVAGDVHADVPVCWIAPERSTGMKCERRRLLIATGTQ